MGQYYKIVLLSTKDKKVSNKKKIIMGFCPDWGAKLMEWSYVGNLTTLHLENILYDNPQRVVVTGDYADEEPQRCKNGNGEWDRYNLYRWVDKLGKMDKNPYKLENESHHRYAINEDKKLYVDLGEDIPKTKYVIHKLVLLLAEGNGRGFGDYQGINADLVGFWARDLIRVSDERPKGYEKMDIEFKE